MYITELLFMYFFPAHCDFLCFRPVKNVPRFQ